MQLDLYIRLLEYKDIDFFLDFFCLFNWYHWYIYVPLWYAVNTKNVQIVASNSFCFWDSKTQLFVNDLNLKKSEYVPQPNKFNFLGHYKGYFIFRISSYYILLNFVIKQLLELLLHYNIYFIKSLEQIFTL